MWVDEEYVCGWVRSMGVGMCVGVWGGGLEGYAFCCNKLDYEFSFLTLKKKIF